MNSQQLGKFTLCEEFVRSSPEIVAKALSDMQFVPVRGELFFCSMEIELQGISHEFDELSIGALIPEYLVHIFSNKTEDGPEEYSHVEVTKL